MPLSSAEAVLRYASDFIPSWSGAISIDLLPGVLVLMLSVAHGALRRQEQAMPFAERITAAELLEAIEVQRALQARGIDIEAVVARAEAKADAKAEAHSEAASEAPEPEPSNVTSLDLPGKPPRKGPQA